MWRLVFAIGRLLTLLGLLVAAAIWNWQAARSDLKTVELALRVVSARPLPKEAELGRMDLAVQVAWIRRSDKTISQVGQIIGWRMRHSITAAGVPIRWDDLIRPPPKKPDSDT